MSGLGERVLVQAMAPFALYLMLLIAWPFKRAIQVYMKDGRLKRALLSRIDGSDRPPNLEKIAKRRAREARIYAFGKKAAAVVRRKFGI